MRARKPEWTGAALAMGVGCSCGAALSAAEIDVVASIKPVHSLVAGVMEGVAQPRVLVTSARSPHDYSLRPSEARMLDGAHVVFWIGEGLETFLVKPLQALSSDAILVALSESDGVGLLATREGGMREDHGRGQLQAEPDPDHEGRAHDEHADSGGEEEHAGHGERDGEGERVEHDEGPQHGHGQFDLHVWLDPHNAEAMVGAIVATLIQADPEHAATYRDNAAGLRQRLRELHESLRLRLAPVSARPFVVFHDAYQYLEHRYDVNAGGSIAGDPGRRPGAQRLGEIRHRLESLDAACVFAEPQFEPALVDIVIEGTNARKGVLDPLGAALDAGSDQYFQLMNELADSLVNCLGRTQPG